MRQRPAPTLRPAASTAGPRAAGGRRRTAPGRLRTAPGRLRIAGAGGDRGATPVELAIVMPAILVLLFSSIQAAAWFVARATALNAAQSAVTAQRVYQAPAGAGRARAVEFLTAAGDWLVGWDSPGPQCATSPTEVACTVRGRALSLVPGVSLGVTETAHGTVERFTTVVTP